MRERSDGLAGQDPFAPSAQGVADQPVDQRFVRDSYGTARVRENARWCEAGQRVDFQDVRSAFTADDEIGSRVVAKAYQAVYGEREHVHARGQIVVDARRHDVRAAAGAVLGLVRVKLVAVRHDFDDRQRLFTEYRARELAAGNEFFGQNFRVTLRHFDHRLRPLLVRAHDVHADRASFEARFDD